MVGEADKVIWTFFQRQESNIDQICIFNLFEHWFNVLKVISAFVQHLTNKILRAV